MGRRIILNNNTMNMNSVNNDFKKESNEKQNSLASGIRIGCGASFAVLKQKFVKIKEAEEMFALQESVLNKIKL